jgi:hypothetical protein
MNATPTLRRRLAQALARHATALLLHHRAEWACAMRAEVHSIEDDGDALRWAFGCVQASYKERLSKLAIYFPGRELLTAIVVTSLFVSLWIYLDSHLVAFAMPGWYAGLAPADPHLSLHLWAFLALGVPEAALAALCGAALSNVVRSATVVTASLALSIWIVTPFAVDMLVNDMSFASYAESLMLFWPDIALRLTLASLAFVLAFRYATKRRSSIAAVN